MEVNEYLNFICRRNSQDHSLDNDDIQWHELIPESYENQPVKSTELGGVGKQNERQTVSAFIKADFMVQTQLKKKPISI